MGDSDSQPGAMMANSTQATVVDVDAFLAASAHPDDGATLKALIAELSEEPATMWGPTMVGFGRYRYRYDSGREGEAFRIGFAPRKPAIVLYLTDGFAGHAELRARLGKHKTGKSCLYIRRLADIDMAVLRELIIRSIAYMDEVYPRT